MTLALQRLVRILDYVDCSQEHAAEEISVLAKFVYENTGPAPSGEEPMRKVISTFVASNYSQLLRSELEELLSSGGDFTRDVNRKMSRRLCAVQQSNDAVLRENEDMRQQIDSLEAQKSSITSQMTSLQQKLDGTKRCRHCGDNFNVLIETSKPMVRCPNCRTRHHFEDSFLSPDAPDEYPSDERIYGGWK